MIRAVYLRCAIEKAKQHEIAIGLRKRRGNDAEGIHERDDNEDLLAAKTVGDAAPEIGADHHANENDRVEPSFRSGIQIQITFSRWQDERHGYDVHLLGCADQAADGQQYVVEFAIFAQFDGPLEVGDYRAVWRRQRRLVLGILIGAIAGTASADALYVLLLAIGVWFRLIAAIVSSELIFRLLSARAQRIRLDDRTVINMR